MPHPRSSSVSLAQPRYPRTDQMDTSSNPLIRGRARSRPQVQPCDSCVYQPPCDRSIAAILHRADVQLQQHLPTPAQTPMQPAAHPTLPYGPPTGYTRCLCGHYVSTADLPYHNTQSCPLRSPRLFDPSTTRMPSCLPPAQAHARMRRRERHAHPAGFNYPPSTSKSNSSKSTSSGSASRPFSERFASFISRQLPLGASAGQNRPTSWTNPAGQPMDRPQPAARQLQRRPTPDGIFPAYVPPTYDQDDIFDFDP